MDGLRSVCGSLAPGRLVFPLLGRQGRHCCELAFRSLQTDCAVSGCVAGVGRVCSPLTGLPGAL